MPTFLETNNQQPTCTAEAVAVAVLAAKQQPRKMMMLLVALQAKRLLAEGLTCEVKKHRTNRAMRRDFLLINAEVMGDR